MFLKGGGIRRPRCTAAPHWHTTQAYSQVLHTHIHKLTESNLHVHLHKSLHTYAHTPNMVRQTDKSTLTWTPTSVHAHTSQTHIKIHSTLAHPILWQNDLVVEVSDICRWVMRNAVMHQLKFNLNLKKMLTTLLITVGKFKTHWWRCSCQLRIWDNLRFSFLPKDSLTCEQEKLVTDPAISGQLAQPPK